MTKNFRYRLQQLIAVSAFSVTTASGQGHPQPVFTNSKTHRVQVFENIMDFQGITVLNLPGGGGGGGGNVVSLVGDNGTSTGLTLIIGGTTQIPNLTLGGALKWTSLDLTGAALPISAVTGLQTALNAKAADSAVIHTTGNETKAGTLTLTSAPVVPDNSFAESKIINLIPDLAAKQVGSANLSALSAINTQPFGLGFLAQDTDTNSRTYIGLGNVDNTSDATKNSAAVSLTNHTIDGRFNSLLHIPTSAIEGWETSTLALDPPAATRLLIWDNTATPAAKFEWLTIGSGLALTGTSPNFTISATGSPGTTLGSNLINLANPSAVTFLRVNVDNSVDALDAAAFRSAIGAGSGGGDVSSNTSSAVDGELALFNGTSGKSLKRAAGTGLVTIASGVASTITDNHGNWDTAFSDRLKWDGGVTGLTAGTGRTSLGATTTGSALFTLADPGAITFLRINADNSVSALDAGNFRTAIGAGTSNFTGAYSALTGLPTLPANTTSTATQFFSAYNSSTGVFTKAQPAFSDINGAATNGQLPGTLSSKTLDDTNAITVKDGSLTVENSATPTKKFVFGGSNITAGNTRTVNIPDANSTTVQAKTSATHKFFSAVSGQGVFTDTQPDYSDLAGAPALPANTTATGSQFFTSYNSTTGAFTKVQPAFSDLSGTLADALGTATNRGINKEVWLSTRTDKKGGTGTAEDPFDCGIGSGETQTDAAVKFDTIMAALGSNVYIHLGVGTFYTAIPKTWGIKDGWTIEGRGESTEIRAIGTLATSNYVGVMGVNSAYYPSAAGSKIKNLRINCNWPELATTAPVGAGGYTAIGGTTVSASPNVWFAYTTVPTGVNPTEHDTITVGSTTGFSAGPATIYMQHSDGFMPITYQSKTSTTFVNCTGHSGPIPAGAYVSTVKLLLNEQFARTLSGTGVGTGRTVLRMPTTTIQPLAAAIASGSNGAVLPQSTINLDDASTFPSGGGTVTILLNNSGAVLTTFTYATKSGNQLQGCTGGSGTLGTGQSVFFGSALPQGTLYVGSTTDFASAGLLLVQTKDGPFRVVKYTGKTSTTFTGCTGGTGNLESDLVVYSPHQMVMSANATASGLVDITFGGERNVSFGAVFLQGRVCLLDGVHAINPYGSAANFKESFCLGITGTVRELPHYEDRYGDCNEIRNCIVESIYGTYGNPYAAANGPFKIHDNYAFGVNNGFGQIFNSGGVNLAFVKQGEIYNNTFIDCASIAYLDTGYCKALKVYDNTLIRGSDGGCGGKHYRKYGHRNLRQHDRPAKPHVQWSLLRDRSE
jgi:hypothetical protein